MMDISATIVPNSDQLNAEDLLAGERTFTIEKVTKGSSEQPVNVHLAELPGRPYRPSKSMRRVLVAAWGKDASAYAGRRLTLYRDPDITFGRDKVGGIKISHMSHIGKRLELALTVKRGSRALHVVDPLPDAPAAPPAATKLSAEDIAACTDMEQLRGMYKAATGDEEMQGLITARVAELRAVAGDSDDG